MKRIFRSEQDRILGGICGGIAQYFNVDSALIRIVWVIFTLFGGSGIIAYLIALLIIPARRESAAKISENDANHRTFWSLLLVAVGLVLLFQHGDLMGLLWHRFWSSGLNLIFSLTLIALGLYFLIERRKMVSESSQKGASTLGIHLSNHHKKLAGVCAGMGETLNLDPVLIRFLWIFGTFMSGGAGILLYIILALILPAVDKNKGS